MVENSLYDKKSLRAVIGKTADWNEIVKDCVAFSNANGGIIDFGIEDDKDFPDPKQIVPVDLPAQMESKLTGMATGLVLAAEIIKHDNGGEFLQLKINHNPYSISVTTSGKVFKRIGDSSKPVSGEDLVRLASEKNGYNWETQTSEFDWTDADKAHFESFMKKIRNSDRLSPFIKAKEDKELLDYLFMTTPSTPKLTNLGVLFLGTQNQRGRIPNSLQVQCIKYNEYGEKVNKWEWTDFLLSPDEIVEDIWNSVPEWRESKEFTYGLFRRNIPAYSEKVIRELLVNAIAHRPYTSKGDIFINIHPSYIEVVNPGPLPMGVTTANILHTTKKRNDHLANLFYRLQLMEREGSGYDMMYMELLSSGKKIPKVTEGEDFVKVTVDRRIVNEEALKVMMFVNQQYQLQQKQVICLGIIVMNESINASQLIKQLYLKDADELKPWLKPLLDKNIVVATDGKTKSKEYRVNNDILKQGQYKGQTSLKRIEDYRLRQLIIEDLQIYAEASVSEISQRIGKEVETRRLKNMLKIMVEKKFLVKIGDKRWTKYKLPK